MEYEAPHSISLPKNYCVTCMSNQTFLPCVSVDAGARAAASSKLDVIEKYIIKSCMKSHRNDESESHNLE